MRTRLTRLTRLTAASAATLLIASGCSSEDADEAGSDSPDPTPVAADTGPRVAVSYEGGVLVLDGETLEVVADLDSEEFTRLNDAGDGRHVMVTVADGFQLLDTGAGTDRDAELTDVVFEADTPGHVVAHAGRTVLYADGTSDTTVVDTADLAAGPDAAETVEGVEAHHGVSIVLEDGTFVTTVGDADSRSGAMALDAAGEVVAESDQCPGIHGEGTAADEVVVLGCEDGALLYADGTFTKVDAPDQPYGRMGNAYVSPTSPLVVGDYKTDPDAEGYLLDALTVIDTAAGSLDVVALPEGVEYTFRDVARGPDDLAYVLATDGAIHTLDPRTREITGSLPVVEPWEGRPSGRTRTPRSRSRATSPTSPSPPPVRCTPSTSSRARSSPPSPSTRSPTRWPSWADDSPL